MEIQNIYFKTVLENANNLNKPRENDYIGENGLLYCGKCKTPRQYILNVFGTTCVVPIMCACLEAEEKERKIRAEISETEYAYYRFKSYTNDPFSLKTWFDSNDYRISERLIEERKTLLQGICFCNEKWKDHTFIIDDCRNPRVSRAAHRFVENFQSFEGSHKGICFYGGVGTGKSFYAACIANALIDKGKSVFMTNFAWIRNKVQESFNSRQNFLEKLNDFDLLILDDIGAEANTEYMQELIFDVIEERSSQGQPLIVTTNLTIEQMNNPESLKQERIYSRILGMTCPVKVLGNDRRIEKLKNDKTKFDKLIGD